MRPMPPIMTSASQGGEHNTGKSPGHIEGFMQGKRNRIRLRHVADAERGQHAEE